MNELTPQNDELDQESLDLLEIEKLSEDLDQLAENALEKALRIGELLSKYRKRFPRNGPRNEPGWAQWVDIHTPFSQRQASKYMQIYQSRLAGSGQTRLEAEWKRMQNGANGPARYKREVQRKAQQELEEETEHGITDAAAGRRCNKIWDEVTKNESEKAKKRLAGIMVSFLVDAYQVNLDDLPDVRIR